METTLDRRARVTVVGTRRSANVALPAQAPIAQYVGTVVRLLGEPTDDLLPATWTLVATGRDPYPPTSSLQSCGVLDGQVLQLCDVLAGEAYAPVVLDVEEAVEDASRRYAKWAWSAQVRVAALLSAAVAWLLATLAAAAILGHPAPARPLAGLAVLTGLLSSGAATALRSRAVPAVVRHLLALAAIPALAFAGGFLAAGHGARPAVGLGVSIGALVGSLLALAALPGTALLAPPLLALVAVAAAAALTGTHAHGADCAATAVMLLLVLAGRAPWAVGRLVAHSPFERGIDPNRPEQVVAQVHRGWQTLVWLEIGVAVAQCGALVWLAGTRQPFALALAACAALALVVGAGTYRQATEVVPNGVAGAVGLFALGLDAAGRFHLAAWIAPVALGGLGCCVLLFALVQAQRTRSAPGPGRFAAPVAGLLRIAALPALVGVYGVLGQLTTLGHRL